MCEIVKSITAAAFMMTSCIEPSTTTFCAFGFRGAAPLPITKSSGSLSTSIPDITQVPIRLPALRIGDLGFPARTCVPQGLVMHR